MSLALKGDFIEKVPLFQGASPELLRDVALQLSPIVFTPGDYVFHAGDIGNEVYFVGDGNLEVISADGKTIHGTLSAGDFFGEIALLSSRPRTAGVRALTYCDLYCLNKDTFDHVLERHPSFAAHIKEIARERWESMEGTGEHPGVLPSGTGGAPGA